MRLSLTMLLVLLPLCAQDGAAPPPAHASGGRNFTPKNLKILKPEELGPAMNSFRVALGVNCAFCHVDGDRASDDNPKKATARMMISMVQEINAKFPPQEGRAYVTCYTCHRGSNKPEIAPPDPGQQSPSTALQTRADSSSSRDR